MLEVGSNALGPEARSDIAMMYCTMYVCCFTFEVKYFDCYVQQSRKVVMSVSVSKSGLQMEVLKLYRMLIRVAKAKDPTPPHHLVSYVRQEFRQSAASVKRTDIKTIEFLIRQGIKQKKIMEMPGFRNNFGPKTSSS